MTTTFSQLTDEIAKELVRPDLLATGALPAWLNQTIREVYTKSNGALCVFADDAVEAVITTDVNDAYVWTIPNIDRFQRTAAVWYPAVGREAVLTEFIQRRFGSDGAQVDRFNYYRSGNTLVFRGFGAAGREIWWAGFYYVRSLVYKYRADRWAEYDMESDTWSFKADTAKTQEELIELSTNWMIRRWPDMLKEGLRAKAYKRIGDEIRMRAAYSQFESLKNAMQEQEQYQGGAFFTR